MKVSDFIVGMLIIVKSKSINSINLETYRDRHPLSTGVVTYIDHEGETIIVNRKYQFKPWDLIPVVDKPKDK